MKEHYVVLNNDGIIRAILSKDEHKLFKTQRDMAGYRIESVDDPKIIKDLIKKGYSAELMNGYVVFSDENEYIIENLVDNISNLESLILKLINEILPIIKLDKNEMTILMDFIEIVIMHQKEYSEKSMECNIFEYQMVNDRFFKMDKIIEPALGVFDP